MKKLPIKYLQIALVALIKDAGYDTDGVDVFPRVEVSGVEMEEGAERETGITTALFCWMLLPSPIPPCYH